MAVVSFSGPVFGNERTAIVPTSVVDFGGFDSSMTLILRGGIHRPMELPGNFESSYLSRENVSREMLGISSKPCAAPMLSEVPLEVRRLPFLRGR